MLPVSRQQLIKLSKLVSDPELSKYHGLCSLFGPEESRPCAHVHYPSTKSFVNHLIWILNHAASCDDIEYHYKLMILLMNAHQLCGVCRNLILVDVPLEMLLFKSELGINLDSRRCSFYLKFHLRLFDHPKFAKIIMKSGSKSLVALQSIDGVLHSLMFQINGRKNGARLYNIRYVPIASQYANTIIIMLLSSRYWEKHHMPDVERLGGLEQYTKWYGEFEADFAESRHWQWLEKLAPPINMLGKAMILTLSRLRRTNIVNCDEIDWQLMKRRIKTGKQIIKCRTKKNLSCSYRQCKNKIDSHSLKLCGGCKITYYCCRSCQKKAWTQHTRICKLSIDLK